MALLFFFFFYFSDRIFIIYIAKIQVHNYLIQWIYFINERFICHLADNDGLSTRAHIGFLLESSQHQFHFSFYLLWDDKNKIINLSKTTNKKLFHINSICTNFQANRLESQASHGFHGFKKAKPTLFFIERTNSWVTLKYFIKKFNLCVILSKIQNRCKMHQFWQ